MKHSGTNTSARFSDALERARRLPESVRRQILWLVVAVVSIAVGAVWVFSFRWQIAPAQHVADEQTDTALPDVRDVLRRSGSSLSAGARDMLRSFLLEEEEGSLRAPRQQESIPSTDPPASRLP